MQQVEFMYAPHDVIMANQWYYTMNVQNAMDATFIGGDASDIIERMLSGDVGVLTISMLGPNGPQDKGVCTMEVQETNAGPHLCVISLTGEDMRHWLDELVMMLKYIAEENDLKGVMFTGRKGWSRTLKRYGFDTVQHIMRLEV